MSPEEAADLAAQLYPAWYGSLIRYAARVTGSVELAQDLVQEAFLLLARELQGGREIMSPKAWTLKVVSRQISKQLVKEKDQGIVLVSLDATQDWGDHVPDALRVGPAYPKDELARYLSLLTVREEEALLLRMEGYRYREIAGELEVNIGTVKTLLSRALQKLQKSGLNVAPRARLSREEWEK